MGPQVSPQESMTEISQTVIVGETRRLEIRIRRDVAFIINVTSPNVIAVAITDADGGAVTSGTGTVDSSASTLTHYLYYLYTPSSSKIGKQLITWTYVVGSETLKAQKYIMVV